VTENTFWQALRKKLVPRVYALKLNLRFAAGVPDCWLSGTLEDLWLELKYLQSVPPVVDAAKYLSGRQKEWLRSRHSEGRNVGVLIGSPEGHVYYPGVTWEAQQLTRGRFTELASPTKEVAETLIEFVGEPLQEGLDTV
jgi:hypothetical protein